VIRKLEPRDYPAVARLLGQTMLSLPEPTPTGVEHWLTSQPERAQIHLLVAEENRRIVGYGQNLLAWYTSRTDLASVWIGVAEDERNRGIGSDLYRGAEQWFEPLGVRTLHTMAVEGTPGIEFALARGFERTRTAYQQRLVLADADLSALAALENKRAAEGLRVVPLNEIRDLSALQELYAIASLDVPEDEPEDNVQPDEFEGHILGDPEMSREASMVVLDGDKPVSLAFLLINPESMIGMSDLTGTLPEYRGRGLARLAKLAVARAALELGVKEFTTENDAENVPIRALNESLGYRFERTIASFKRDL
jgi:GNAT superfamily N-acetyltransferase